MSEKPKTAKEIIEKYWEKIHFGLSKERGIMTKEALTQLREGLNKEIDRMKIVASQEEKKRKVYKAHILTLGGCKNIINSFFKE